MGLIEFENDKEYSACIKVVGVGGGGSNAVNAMVRSHIQGVEFIIANTDAQALDASPCVNRVQVGVEVTKGLGAPEAEHAYGRAWQLCQHAYIGPLTRSRTPAHVISSTACKMPQVVLTGALNWKLTGKPMTG